LYQCREKTETDQRGAEEREGQASKEWGEWRIGDVAPGKVTRVFEDRKLIAIETVAPGREQMNEKSARANQDKDCQIISIAQEGIGSLRRMGGCRGVADCDCFYFRRHGNLKRKRHDSRRELAARGWEHVGQFLCWPT